MPAPTKFRASRRASPDPRRQEPGAEGLPRQGATSPHAGPPRPLADPSFERQAFLQGRPQTMPMIPASPAKSTCPSAIQSGSQPLRRDERDNQAASLSTAIPGVQPPGDFVEPIRKPRCFGQTKPRSKPMVGPADADTIPGYPMRFSTSLYTIAFGVSSLKRDSFQPAPPNRTIRKNRQFSRQARRPRFR